MTWGVSWLAHWIKYQNTASGGDLIFYPEEGIEDNPEGVLKVIYPMDFKMHRGGKGANPREHSELCDRGERVQPAKRQLEG
ncbi:MULTISPECIES: bacteriocin immunity protein [Photorhabdus]|uniref:bacteriocin immunity protein n=1 Tax=Photorhabdus TaxID=29487 RepID=UPI000D6DC36F|nr:MULTISPECIES: bacteriocin immunity protein [Photorhabdus]AXG42274.1 hypothetical protein PluDJC_08415 [Photorhabdus laumondii subsp. laumondii]AXG46796.1 hypothetical protein PluTT01m_08425 [Photorhabdus laumondii subsp. laumondii]